MRLLTKLNFVISIALAALISSCSGENKAGSTANGGRSSADGDGSTLAASNLIISPDVTGIPTSFDTEDKQIFFSWTPSQASVSEVKEYVILRYELPRCSGLSIETGSTRGTSFPFVGEEEKTYSFKVITYSNAGSTAESVCSNDLTVDTLPPSATSIKVNNDYDYTNNSVVTLALEAKGAVHMYVTNAEGCVENGVWEAYSAKKSWTLGQKNGVAMVYVKYKDSAGNTSDCIGDAINHDSIAPADPSITLNAGLPYVTTMSVSLKLESAGASEMYITNTAACLNGGTWQAFSANSSWTLTESNTTATVYAKVRDAAGNESACTSDAIVHDDVMPKNTAIFINSGADYTNSTSSTLSIESTDASEMYITNTEGCVSGGAWEPVSTHASWTLAKTNAKASIYAKFRDAAGNESSCINDTIIHDNILPSLSYISISNGAKYTMSASVALTVASAGADEMYITNTAGCLNGGSWQPFLLNPVWKLEQTNSTATVYAKVRDAAGNESRCVSDTVIHDDILPSNTSISINSGADYTKYSAVFLTLSFAGANEMYITNSTGCLGGGVWQSVSSSVSWLIAETNSVATVYSKFKDAAGNESPCISDKIIHDDIPPSASSISINSGAVYTKSISVSLTLASSGASEMYITNTAGCTSGGVWQGVSDNTSWVLASANTLTTVYAMFRDTSGNQSLCINDAIVHDSIAPAEVSFLSKSMIPSSGFTRSVALTLSARDAIAMYLTETAGCTSNGTWETYSPSKVWTFSQPNGVVKIYTKYVDDAGNESSCTEHNVALGWSVATLTKARYSMAATSVGVKAFFAGGISNGVYSNQVDIYDSSSDSWTATQLSQARSGLAATAVGTKVFFAGGYGATGRSDVIDIYDSSTDTWSIEHLSVARTALVAAAVGTKAFFAGGASTGPYDLVDIYDSSDDTWSTARLSRPRESLTAVTVGSKIIFAGGFASNGISNIVDIYDAATNVWSTATLSVARLSIVATTVGSKAFFAGGSSAGKYTNVIDVYDSTTNSWSTAALSKARTGLAATSVGSKVMFAGGIQIEVDGSAKASDLVDVYDSLTDSWSTSTLSQARFSLSATSIGNKAIFVGGNSKVGGNMANSEDSNAADIYVP